MNNSSLRRQLVFIITFLVLFVSSAIVWVSIRAGSEAVNNLTQRVLLDMVERIGNDSEHHLTEAMVALESVAPDANNVPVGQHFSTDFTDLENRLWAASGLYRQSNYVYFGGPDARFIGVNRINNDHVELYLRTPTDSYRARYNVVAPGDRSHLIRNDTFDPRSRPWYVNAITQNQPVWSDVYNDFSTREPTITLAKAIYQPDHSLAGVVATDLTLKNLTEFLRNLNISKNSVAFIVDADGYLIATSSADLPFKEVNHLPQRILAEDMPNDVIRNTYRQGIKNQIYAPGAQFSLSKTVDIASGKVDMAIATLGSKYGLKWVTVVAVPRADFMSGITRSVYQSIGIVVLFIVLSLVIGLTVVEHVLRDIRQLTSAARKVGNGEPLPRLHIHRKDEIGHLVSTFIEMEHKLRFDRLTQVYNRDFLVAQIEFLERHASSHPEEQVNFTLLFIDLDKFKFINDSYGHEAGDQVLIVIASRLKAAVRETDTVARYGGDEFVVLLNGTSKNIDIQTTVEKICALVEQPIALTDSTVSVGVSVGWAVFPTEGLNYASLVRIADSRMFSIKKDRHEANVIRLNTKF